MSIGRTEVSANEMPIEDRVNELLKLLPIMPGAGAVHVKCVLAELERLRIERDMHLAQREMIRAERDQLRAECERYRKDAERYRWLRKQDWLDEATMDGRRIFSFDPSTLDAAIDSEMHGQPK